ncbi:MAG: LysM peptidoglycan-binding domain-containing protein [Gemmatimonadaceae bacterium]
MGSTRRYHTSVASIVGLNHLSRQVVFPGQTIIVGGSSRGAERPRLEQGAIERKGAASAKSKKVAPKEGRLHTEGGPRTAIAAGQSITPLPW